VPESRSDELERAHRQHEIDAGSWSVDEYESRWFISRSSLGRSESSGGWARKSTAERKAVEANAARDLVIIGRPKRAPLRLLSVVEAAGMLGISERGLKYVLAVGDIRSLKIGQRRLIPVEALNEYVESRLVEEDVVRRSRA
jgi:excisionase family DNA binding protein